MVLDEASGSKCSQPLRIEQFRLNKLCRTNLEVFYIFHVRIIIVFLTMGTEYACSKRENKFAKLALVALAAGVLTLGSVDQASAAKSGGRVGGQAFKSPSPGRSSSSSPRINNSRYFTLCFIPNHLICFFFPSFWD